MSNRESLFDLAGEYEQMLNQGIRLSGEDQRYFIEGRLRDLGSSLSKAPPRRILDFGCGVGTTSAALAARFPEALVFGVDTSERAILAARSAHGGDRVRFQTLDDFAEKETFDLVYCNGVFHHIAPGERLRAATIVRDALVPGGHFSLFENNPWNPGTRMVMARIPFDRDAIPLSPPEASRLLRQAGFELNHPTRFLFFFPRPLAFLRFLEPLLVSMPLGAQYHVIAAKASG